MKFNLVDKSARMELSDIIKYQIITYCYINNKHIYESDLQCLTLLAEHPELNLTTFCQAAVDRGIFKTTQSVRNCIAKLEKMGLLIKDGKSNKRLFLNGDMCIQTNGNILLNYKFYTVREANQTP